MSVYILILCNKSLNSVAQVLTKAEFAHKHRISDVISKAITVNEKKKDIILYKFSLFSIISIFLHMKSEIFVFCICVYFILLLLLLLLYFYFTRANSKNRF